MRELALMIAVAQGVDLATARQRLDAAFPAPAAPGPGDVTGHRVERFGDPAKGGQLHERVVEILGDGQEREKSRRAIGPAPTVQEAKEP